MAVLSKLFKEQLERLSCNELGHKNSCTYFTIHNIYGFLLSNAKYFAPVTFLPLLVRIRKLNKDVLKDAVKYYIQLVLTGFASGWSIQIFMCLFRNLLGKNTFYTFTFLPSAIGITTSLLSPPRVLHLFRTSVFQCTIESFIMRRRNFLTRAVADSVTVQTLIFMCCSSLILHASQQKLYKGFWFLSPNPKARVDINVEEPPTNVCAHKEQDCGLYLIKGVRNYFAIGLTLDIIKMLMSNAPSDTQGFVAKLMAKIGNFKIASTAFLASYMGIYRSAHCYFNRNAGASLEINHLMAGFLGGACYVFFPSYTLLAYAIILCLPLIWNILLNAETKIESLNKLLWYLKRIPLGNMAYPFALAYVVHTYALRRKYIGSLGEAIVNGLTNNYAKNVQLRIQDIQATMDATLKSSI